MFGWSMLFCLQPLLIDVLYTPAIANVFHGSCTRVHTLCYRQQIKTHAHLFFGLSSYFRMSTGCFLAWCHCVLVDSSSVRILLVSFSFSLLNSTAFNIFLHWASLQPLLSVYPLFEFGFTCLLPHLHLYICCRWQKSCCQRYTKIALVGWSMTKV